MTERWVILADTHFPLVHLPTWGVALELIKDLNARVLFQGDQFHNDEISHHNASKPAFAPMGIYRKNQEAFDNHILKPLEAATSSPKVWIIGNHDEWEREYIDSFPHLEGMIERPQTLHLADRGWEIIPVGHSKSLGDLKVIHGEMFNGATSLKRAVDVYGKVLKAHTHSPEQFTKVAPVDQPEKHRGWTSPILGMVNPHYLRNKPTAWSNGVTLVEIHDGIADVFPLVLTNGKVSYAGKIYGLSGT